VQEQKIALTSHTLYGSSRLGVKQYMPGQFYAQWDYTGTVPAMDTAFLTQRRSWYSHAQNDVITPAAEDPVGRSDTSTYAVQH